MMIISRINDTFWGPICETRFAVARVYGRHRRWIQFYTRRANHERRSCMERSKTVHAVPLCVISKTNFLSSIDVGGKLLTNQLKELTSFRQWNMMDETYIMNNVKEACCYVSLDFKRDLETCRCALVPT